MHRLVVGLIHCHRPELEPERPMAPRHALVFEGGALFFALRVFSGLRGLGLRVLGLRALEFRVRPRVWSRLFGFRGLKALGFRGL